MRFVVSVLATGLLLASLVFVNDGFLGFKSWEYSLGYQLSESDAAVATASESGGNVNNNALVLDVLAFKVNTGLLKLANVGWGALFSVAYSSKSWDTPDSLA